MKVNRLEAHDRYEYLIKNQSLTVSQGAEDCLKKNPLSLSLQAKSPYVYIFGHSRSDDFGCNKRLLWQARLLKPEAQPNSYLFRAQSNTDLLEVCWILPPEEFWSQYQKKNVIEGEFVTWSINQFRYNRKDLERPFKDDLSEEEVRRIYLEIKNEMEEKRRSIKPHSSEASQSSALSLLTTP